MTYKELYSNNLSDDVFFHNMPRSSLPTNNENKRKMHNELERKRRGNIKENFQQLYGLVPCESGERSSRAQILNSAIKHITYINKHEASSNEFRSKCLRDIDRLKFEIARASSSEEYTFACVPGEVAEILKLAPTYIVPEMVDMRSTQKEYFKQMFPKQRRSFPNPAEMQNYVSKLSTSQPNYKISSYNKEKGASQNHLLDSEGTSDNSGFYDKIPPDSTLYGLIKPVRYPISSSSNNSDSTLDEYPSMHPLFNKRDDEEST